MRAVLAAFVLVLIHAASLLVRLPETVASHFGAQGMADGWTSRSSFVLIYVVVGLTLALAFGGIAMLMRRWPESLWNLPNREHWLAPERRETTIRSFVGSMSRIGVGSQLLMVAVMESVRVANQAQHPVLPGAFLWVLFGAMGLLLVEVVGMHVRFRRV